MYANSQTKSDRNILCVKPYGMEQDTSLGHGCYYDLCQGGYVVTLHNNNQTLSYKRNP